MSVSNFAIVRQLDILTVFTKRNHPKPTVLYVPQYVANFVSKKSCSI